MRIAYLDCFAGISGDMLLGALVDAGVPAEVLQDATRALALRASLKIERVDRSGISCTKVHVLEDDHLAAQSTHQSASRREDPAENQSQTAPSISVQHQTAAEDKAHTHHPKTQHLHKTGHAHTHNEEHGHAVPGHGRSLTQIRALIQEARLEEAIKKMAIHAFELLGNAEAKIHNVAVDEIHFHEVGAVDAIVDIVAASAGIHHLRVESWYCSALNVGGGMVECAHGTFPVPAPATADLLRGIPTYSAYQQKELVTPTGAALLRALDPIFGAQPGMRVERIGYGAGTRDPKNFPNVLRIHVGEAVALEALSGGLEQPSSSSSGVSAIGSDSMFRQSESEKPDSTTVAVLETALDDLSPQILASVTEMALARGALDVMLTPVIMKKGRPGTLLTVLCNPSERYEMERLIVRETSTLGVRIRHDRRLCLERSHTPVRTEYGEIRMKIGSLKGEELNAAPEFEDCRAAAGRHDVPVKSVQQAAIAAYHAMRQ